jgi:DNA-binding NtrC family response regulator
MADLQHTLGAERGFEVAEFPSPTGTWTPAAQATYHAFDPDLAIACPAAEDRFAFGTLLARLREGFRERPVLVVVHGTDGHSPLDYCELGASDFALPPFRPQELLARIRRLVTAARRPEQVAQAIKERIGLERLIGESASFQQAIRRLPQIARSTASVLISGESGTGKEVVARAIHYLGPSGARPFICVNCGAIPEHLVESELFGHKRGAFTGAIADRTGLVHEAEGGTLFLDEVDSLPRPAQVKLLRLLQDGEYRMVGSSQATRARVRVIAAGNGDFRQLLRDGRFREDLYYRLNVLSLALPPLRERRSDIPALSRHFLEKHAALSEQPVKALAPAALDRLIAHEWPGNVRELENTLARAHVLTESATIQAGDLDLPEPASPDALSFRAMKAQLVHQFERTYLQDIVRTHEGNITRAARAAGKNRRAFYELLRKHGLPCASR